MSCVRASGRGEAVSACERGVFVNAGPQDGEMYSGRGCAFCVFTAICKDFRKNVDLIAIRKGFKEIFSIYCYTQGF